jgi:putative ABC transport system permease protein
MKKRLSSSLLREVLKMAMDSVYSNKFRSFLTILGIVVGVFTAIVVASILTGMRQSIVGIVEEYGTNNITVFHLSNGIHGSNRDERNRKPLTVDDAEAISSQSPAVEGIALIAPGIGNFGPSFDDNITYEGKNYRRANTDGVSANYDRISNMVLRTGRFISESDDAQRRSVLVLGVNAADALFPQGGDDPLGKVVRMNGQTWEIIGVVEKRKAGFFGENEEDSKVFLPYRTARKVAPQRDFLKLIVQAKEGRLVEAAEDIEGILRQRREVKFDDPNNFDATTADKFIEQFDGIIGGIGLAAIAISCLGLLVGGIGVMNIMLVSVTERTKEIGVRKAVGATKGAIVMQFLLEAMALTFFGGIIGVLSAIGISKLIMLLIPSLPASVPTWAVVLGLVVSIGTGLVFGVLPARKASRLDPIECLRYE